MRKLLIPIMAILMLSGLVASAQPGSAMHNITCNGKSITFSNWTLVSIGPDGEPGFPTVVLEVSGTSGNDVFAPYDEQTDSFPLRITGGNGNDTICGGIWDDDIRGGGGNDWISGKQNNDLIYGGGGNDIIYGGSGNDTLRGNSGTDYLYGKAGNDTIYGGTGTDYLYGGSWADYLDEGGQGGPMYGEGGYDTCKATYAQAVAGIAQCEKIIYY